MKARGMSLDRTCDLGFFFHDMGFIWWGCIMHPFIGVAE